MKYFVRHNTSGDTCGNSSYEGGPVYYSAKNLKALWDYLKKPRVTAYTVKSGKISCFRTPHGKGYGQWENNPNFDIDYGLSHGTGFEVTLGFNGYEVWEINMEKV